MAQQVVVKNPVKFLALGDSYTIGQSVSQKDSWPYQFRSFLADAGVSIDTIAIIAQTGWTTSNLKNAIAAVNPKGKFNLVSLLIGVNNQYQGMDQSTYIAEFEELLNTAIELAGSKENVFVVSIPDYGFTPFGKSNQAKITEEINAYNAINQSITSTYNVAYFNITEISRQGLVNPDLVASDGLHPSGEMYRLWVDLIAKGVKIQNGVTDLEDISLNNKSGLKIYTNSSDKSISFWLNPLFMKNDSYIEIYQLDGKQISRSQSLMNNTFYLGNKGIYIYRIRTSDKIMYQGKVLLY